MMRTNYDVTADPTVPRSQTGIYPSRFVPYAMLMDDGLTIVGWVPRPDGEWKPEELLWSPPGSKSGPIAVGVVEDVMASKAIDYDWVTTQLKRRQNYLDRIREMVARGTVRLTAALAKMLGLPFDATAIAPLASPAPPVPLAPAEPVSRAELERIRSGVLGGMVH